MQTFWKIALIVFVLLYKTSTGKDEDPCTLKKGHVLWKIPKFAEEGKTIQFACDHCSTAEKAGAPSLWYKLDHLKIWHSVAEMWQPVEVHLDMHDDEQENRVIVIKDHTLVIKDFKEEDEGTYFCVKTVGKKVSSVKIQSGDIANALKSALGDAVSTLYFANMEVKPKLFTLVSEAGLAFPKPRKKFVHSVGKWQLYSGWGSWGHCNACGQPAERRRQGRCIVQLSCTQCHANPVSLDHTLQLFPGGAPCHSTLFKKYPAIFDQPAEIEVAQCSIDCKILPNKTKGWKMEALESKLDKLRLKSSRTKTIVEERFIKEHEGGKVQLYCPGATFETEVLWKNGSEVMRITEIALETENRVTIDALNVLFIHHLLGTDAGEYICSYEEKKRAVFTIEVLLKEAPPIEIQPYLTMLMGAFVFDFFLFMAAMILKHRMRYIRVGKKQRGFKPLVSESGAYSEDLSTSSSGLDDTGSSSDS